MKISEHITFLEATKSQTGSRLGIENKPNPEQLEAMRFIAENIFEKVRNHFEIPLQISSFFRCYSLNKAIGGAATSQHCKGEAIDIDSNINAKIFHYIKDNLEFDQLIWEFGDKHNPDWVHASLKKEGNRRQVLRATRSAGVVKYIDFKI
jgi:zinc D-Ala-D-Ala carboxypeptidase